MKINKIKESISDNVFNIVNLILLTLLAVTCLFPFINTASISLSSNEFVLAGDVYLLPKGFVTTAYKAVFSNASMVRSMLFTIYLTIVYTLAALFMTILCAYPLSKMRLRGRKFFTIFIMITMYFSGGMIPSYLLISELGLINKMSALILPGIISTFNMIIMRSFFLSLPASLEESAVLDGANDLTVLIKIVLPLTKPILATLALFYAVSRWNSFQDALFYINKPEMFPLQLKLRQLISLNLVDEMLNSLNEENNTSTPETLKAASLIFATLPILLIYPWLQKYFIKGIMVGAVKG